MTKKDFIAIAAAIKAAGSPQVAYNLLPYLRACNPNFDEKRFLTACGA